MYIATSHKFIEARLRSQLSDLLGSYDVGNGTPLADAAATALALDMRKACMPATALNALDRETLIDVAAGLRWALNRGGDAEVDLPFGTKAVCRVAGEVAIGSAHYMLDAARPGLHPMETMRRDAHGPNLERLRTLIARRTRKLACRRLGLPRPSSIADNEMRHHLQFAACPEAGGVVLQRRACETGADRFCAALPGQLSAFADSIVRDMRELWKHRAIIKMRVEAVRRAAEAHILAEHGVDAPVSIRTIAVEMCGDTGDTPVSLYIEMDGIGEALRPGKVLEYVPARDDVDSPWFRFCDHHAFRSRDLAELTALGATGRISDLAARVAAAAPEGRAAVLARLGQDVETQVVMATSEGDLYATLFWRNGYIEAEVSIPGHLETYSNRIELRAPLSTAAIADAVGRPFGDVATLPFHLPSVIDEVQECNDGWMRYSVHCGHALVNCDTGAVWPEPEGPRSRQAAAS